MVIEQQRHRHYHVAVPLADLEKARRRTDYNTRGDITLML